MKIFKLLRFNLFLLLILPACGGDTTTKTPEIPEPPRFGLSLGEILDLDFQTKPQVSADGERVLFFAKSQLSPNENNVGAYLTVGLGNLNFTQVLVNDKPLLGAFLSPDGKVIISVSLKSNKDVLSFHRENESSAIELPESDSKISRVDFSDDSKIAIISRKESIFLLLMDSSLNPDLLVYELGADFSHKSFFDIKKTEEGSYEIYFLKSETKELASHQLFKTIISSSAVSSLTNWQTAMASVPSVDFLGTKLTENKVDWSKKPSHNKKDLIFISTKSSASTPWVGDGSSVLDQKLKAYLLNELKGVNSLGEITSVPQKIGYKVDKIETSSEENISMMLVSQVLQCKSKSEEDGQVKELVAKSIQTLVLWDQDKGEYTPFYITLEGKFLTSPCEKNATLFDSILDFSFSKGSTKDQFRVVFTAFDKTQKSRVFIWDYKDKVSKLRQLGKLI